ncbi:MAG: VOC family protein [Angustibacter sp.]
MATRFEAVVVNALDPPAQARWWADALGWRITYSNAEEVGVEPPEGEPGLELCIGLVPDDKVRPNRVHLDLASRSTEHQRELVDRLLAAGAIRADVGQPTSGPGAVPWVVLRDQEGNELCVLEPRDVYADTGSLAAVVVPSRDVQVSATFWEAATGWQEAPDRGAGYPALRSSTGGPFLEFLPADDAPAVPERVHLDVRPLPGHPQDAEVARLLGLGARPADIGQADVPWVVLTDPDGLTLCVLSTPQA